MSTVDQHDEFPDVDFDVPVTPCPDWCENPHCKNGEGKDHQGALTTVEGVNWVAGGISETRKHADVFVALCEERPVLNIYADTDLDDTGAMDLSIGLVKAVLLYRRLTAENG